MVNRRLEERKVETRQIVVEEVRKDEEIQKNLDAEAGIADVDTDDENNEAEEYEAWKTREIARLKRDREGREATMKEKEEIEKVRNMTEEERREWERRNPKPLPAPKQKWRFMQKYYHKGAFFQSNADDRMSTAGMDAIYERNFSAPTGEDKMDKSILPKVMQVKHFGRSGRTKWTHLVNEDTADWKYLSVSMDSCFYLNMLVLILTRSRSKNSKKQKFGQISISLQFYVRLRMLPPCRGKFSCCKEILALEAAAFVGFYCDRKFFFRLNHLNVFTRSL